MCVIMIDCCVAGESRVAEGEVGRVVSSVFLDGLQHEHSGLQGHVDDAKRALMELQHLVGHVHILPSLASLTGELQTS